MIYVDDVDLVDIDASTPESIDDFNDAHLW